jgi:hypothetical protein
MGFHERQIYHSISVEDCFGQKQPFKGRVALKFYFNYLVFGEIDDRAACRFNCSLGTCFVKSCPARIVEAVGLAALTQGSSRRQANIRGDSSSV